MSLFKKITIIFGILIGIGLLSLLGVVSYIYILSKELPKVSDIGKFQYNEPMVVYDTNGIIIAELGAERRYPVSIEDTPKYLSQAMVAVEDARFYEHSGVDPIGILRAFFTNLKAGRLVEGGSTLTQQLAKILYLSPERKLQRKIKEAILAYKIDKYLTKDNILELYLNQVNFGRGAYGVQAAAVNYFGKNVTELTLAEAALIAGIPKAPSGYAPHLNMDKAIERRNHVLYRMYEVGYITEQEYKSSSEEVVVITDSIPLKLRYAGYFMDYVHKYLEEELKMDESMTSGLKIYTTLNLDYQLAAENAVKNNIIRLSKREGYYGSKGNVEMNSSSKGSLSDNPDIMSTGLISKYDDLYKVPSYLNSLGFQTATVKSVDVKEVIIDINGIEGKILLSNNDWAVSHGSSELKLKDFREILNINDVIYVTQSSNIGEYNLEQDPKIEGAMVSINPTSGEIYAIVGGFSYEKSFFNRSTQAKRQTGSVFKPFVYATAYESGLVPMDKILDVPVIAEGRDGEKSWKPKNYEDKFYGETTLKEALVKSRNVVTIRVAEKVGIKKIIRYAKNFGITSDIPVDLSVSLGSASASPLELAYAYSTFVNLGSRPAKPYFIKKIEDINGKIIYEEAPPKMIQVLSPVSSQLVLDSLIGVIDKGSGWRAKVIPRVVAGKTGTTNESKDAWFAGILPSMITISWVGYDDFSKMGSYAAGSSSAVPQWLEYTKSILETMPFELFPKGSGVGYFKVDNETKEITDSITGDYIYEIYPIDMNGKPTTLKRNIK